MERIIIKANRNITGTKRKTVWSMLTGSESYSVDLPEGFAIIKGQDGSPVIRTPKGEVYQPYQIIEGNERPYLKIGYKVFPLSNFSAA